MGVVYKEVGRWKGVGGDVVHYFNGIQYYHDSIHCCDNLYYSNIIKLVPKFLFPRA